MSAIESTDWTTWRTCRFCRVSTNEDGLIKYGVRHYAHPKCGLQREGGKFFDRLTLWQLTRFPALVAADFGLLDELRRRAGNGSEG